MNLWGDLSACTAQAGSPPYVKPVNKPLDLLAQILAEGNRLRISYAGQEGVADRRGLEEARAQRYEPTNPPEADIQGPVSG